jgi:hypothetical protein
MLEYPVYPIYAATHDESKMAGTIQKKGGSLDTIRRRYGKTKAGGYWG